MSVLSDAHFHDEQAAYDVVEARLWPNGPICPHCGAADRSYTLKGKSTRIGVRKYGHCRKQFTVKVGTIFEDSHVPMNKWLQAIYLLTCSKKDISSHQLYRILGVSLTTAWFMGHRIREAIRDGSLGPVGDRSDTIEADETYFGEQDNPPPSPQRKGRPYTKGGKTGPAAKRAVLGLVERGGKIHLIHVGRADKGAITRIVRDNVTREAALMTDESRLYIEVGGEMASHDTVKHSVNEYERGIVHTNTIEGSFSIFKRGIKGIYRHCREKHLHCYLTEFEFRYNNRVALGVDETARADAALLGAVGKRLEYRQSN